MSVSMAYGYLCWCRQHPSLHDIRDKCPRPRTEAYAYARMHVALSRMLTPVGVAVNAIVDNAGVDGRAGW